MDAWSAATRASCGMRTSLMTRRPAATLAMCALVLLLPIHTVAAQTFEELFEQRFQDNTAYLQSQLALHQAQLRYDQLSRPLVPYVSLASDAGVSGAIATDADELVPNISLTPAVRFANLLRADVSLATTLSYRETLDGTPQLSVGTPTLSFSRSLFEESASETLSAQASLVRAEAALEAAEYSVRVALVSEILDAYSAVRSLEENRRNLEVLNTLYDAASDPDQARQLERQILIARRSIIQAENQVEDLDAVVADNLAALYDEVTALATEWVTDLPAAGTIPEAGAQIQALEMELLAAEADAANAFLAYAPNPAISASIGYNTDTQQLQWSVSLRMGATALDQGERALEAANRRMAPQLAELELAQAIESLVDTVDGLWDSIELQRIDLRLAELDHQDAMADLETTQQLVERGFATEEDLIVAEIQVSMAELSLLSAEHERLTTKLSLLGHF